MHSEPTATAIHLLYHSQCCCSLYNIILCVYEITEYEINRNIVEGHYHKCTHMTDEGPWTKYVVSLIKFFWY